MKMCRKDGCCSGWLGPETSRVAITTSHCGTGHDVFSKSELRKKNQNNKPTTQVPSGETAWNRYPNSIIVVQDSSGVVDWCMYEQPTELGSSYIAIDSMHLMSSRGVTSSI